MYGLPKSGNIPHELLKKRLAKEGYHPTKFTPGVWKHVWRPITFTLVVDDFGIKFEGENHANHLVSTLKKYYDITVYWKEELFVGIKLKWEYDKRTLDTHIPNFVPKALHKYQHVKPKIPQHAPEKAVPIQYRENIQVEEKDTSPHISPARIKHIQDFVGTFAWYTRSVDPKMAATMSSIASRQSKGTENLEK